MAGPSAPTDGFAFYLPQFYPVPLNSTWWGEGHTEWNSLARAMRGSRSPRYATITPGELGFYDLRLTETRARQADLARRANLAAFCVYHYYSSGNRALPTIVDQMLRDGEPNFPFFFCWANHDWTRAWMNQPADIIFRQEYNESVDDSHVNWLLECFSDERYYKIGSAPVLAIYAPEEVPDRLLVFSRWRQLARDAGFSGLVLLGIAHESPPIDAEQVGIDGWIQNPLTAMRSVPAWRRVAAGLKSPSRTWRLLRYGDYPISRSYLSRLNRRSINLADGGLIPTVITSFNNTGRRRRRGSYLSGSPYTYAHDLALAVDQAPTVVSPDGSRRLVAINAWNEWGEAMALEPSVEHGDELIQITARLLQPRGTDE